MGFLYVLLGIVALFFAVLIAKQILSKGAKEKVCAICLASTLTWLVLLILYYTGRFENLLIIGLLMGATVLGVFYSVEKVVRKELTFFRLPFLLTLFTIGYFLLTLENIYRELVLLVVLWGVFALIYGYRNSSGMKGFVDKIVECCKKW